jgi:hypothetical protein
VGDWRNYALEEIIMGLFAYFEEFIISLILSITVSVWKH